MGEGKTKLTVGMPIYHYLKYSRVFRWYERLFQPWVIRAHEKEVGLYRSFLGRCRLIFDIGAYDGHKTAAFLEIAGKVVACEPDLNNFSLLRIRFRGKTKRVILMQMAVADRTGTGLFHIHHPGSAFNTLNLKWKEMLEADQAVRWNEVIRFSEGGMRQVRVTTLDELIRLYGVPDFIKIDVEGYEKQVIDGLSQKVPCISFECQLPEFRDDLQAVLAKLIDLDRETKFNIVYEETLVLPEFVSYGRILEWLGGTNLYSFDMVAKRK
jgi:FkbM family methyltransferase